MTVRARPYGWAQARAEAQKALPDPAIPAIPAGAWVQGDSVEVVTTHTRFGSYQRHQIAGQDIEPTTLENTP